jgi:hypothetical protein
LLTGCSLYSTSTRWNGRVGTDGKPIFIKTSTNIGINLFVMLPLAGHTTITEMIDATTERIAAADGDRVRIIETELENYWYGLPPLSWIFSPVSSTVCIEYSPSDAELAKVRAEEAREAERIRARNTGDNSHVIPAAPKQQ